MADPEQRQSMTEASAGMVPDRYAELYGTVSATIAELLGVNQQDVRPASTLVEFGAESFDFVDLAFRLETTYAIDLPRSFFVPDGYTVDTLVRAIAEALSAGPSN